MIRILFTLAILFAPTLSIAQTYPTAEPFKGFHSEIYTAAVKAHEVATEAEVELPVYITAMKRYETDLRKALDEETNSYRFEIALSGYIASSRLVETTGNLIFDRTILVTIMTDNRHRGDGGKMRILGEWLRAASAFQKKIDGTIIKADQRLINAGLDKQKKLAAKK